MKYVDYDEIDESIPLTLIIILEAYSDYYIEQKIDKKELLDKIIQVYESIGKVLRGENLDDDIKSEMDSYA